MEATSRAIERLTTHHTEHTDAGPVEWPPLLEWLKQRISEITRQGGGLAGPGIPLNENAADLLASLEARYRALCKQTNTTPMTQLTTGVSRLWELLQADRAGGRITDTDWENLTTEFPEWVYRIEAEQEKPRKMELTTACPRCGNRWILDNIHHRVAAVVIEFAPGRAPVAECRHPDCTAIWAGWADVARLGATIGATQDTAILTACGIPKPETTTM